MGEVTVGKIEFGKNDEKPFRERLMGLSETEKALAPAPSTGIMNKLRSRIQWRDQKDLDITPSFLNGEGIAAQIGLGGTIILTANLVKTLDLALKFSDLVGKNLGRAIVTLDTTTFPPFEMSDCRIEGVFIEGANGAKAAVIIAGFRSEHRRYIIDHLIARIFGR